jgi:hypothetical protein
MRLWKASPIFNEKSTPQSMLREAAFAFMTGEDFMGFGSANILILLGRRG